MSKMSQLHSELIELIDQGYGPFAIAAITNTPLSVVQDLFDSVMQDTWYGQSYDESEFEGSEAKE